MKPALTLLFFASISTLGCQAPVAFGQNEEGIFRQGAIADIACGPSSLFNWMSHGDLELKGVLAELSSGRTPVQTVQHIIDEYGKRQSATNPSVKRYGPHNGGVGSVNLLLMAKDLLSDHLDSPRSLRGEYLHRIDSESPEDHLKRITGWFARSIESGVPVIQYMRRYQRTSHGGRPRMIFGHHVVVTAIEEQPSESSNATARAAFTFVDSSSGRVDHGELVIAKHEFTAPTFTYRFEGERALTTEKLRTGRPLLEIRVPSYESGNSSKTEIMVAHFATFAGN